MMSVLPVVFGGVILAIGIIDGAQALLPTTAVRALARALRAGTGTSKWQLLTTSLLQVVTGVLLLVGLLHSSVALGWVCLALLIGIRLVNSDLRSWRRSRHERKLANAADGRHPAVLTESENSPFARRLRVAAAGWQALRDRQASLDRRVESGEISAETRDRYMTVHRRQLIRRLGYNNPLRWPERLVVSALLPLMDAPVAPSASRPGSAGRAPVDD
ncbi:MAG: hypothetical protein ACRDPO_28420 [Streptosporangiaceae bacterium]